MRTGWAGACESGGGWGRPFQDLALTVDELDCDRNALPHALRNGARRLEGFQHPQALVALVPLFAGDHEVDRLGHLFELAQSNQQVVRQSVACRRTAQSRVGQTLAFSQRHRFVHRETACRTPCPSCRHCEELAKRQSRKSGRASTGLPRFARVDGVKTCCVAAASVRSQQDVLGQRGHTRISPTATGAPRRTAVSGSRSDGVHAN